MRLASYDRDASDRLSVTEAEFPKEELEMSVELDAMTRENGIQALRATKED